MRAPQVAWFCSALWPEITPALTEGQTVRFDASIAINMTPAVMMAVRSGAGLSVLPDFLATGGLKNGELLPVLTQWHLPPGGVYTVYPAARFRPPKVTAFVEMLIESLKG